MIWLLVLSFTFISAAVIYSKRYTSKVKIGGLTLVQFFYLVMVTPFSFISLLNIALEIVKRPEMYLVPIPPALVFSIFIFSISIGAVGSSIHATSTSVAQAFPKRSELKAFFINEKFHGPLSHNLLHLGAVSAAVCLALLELNHPLVQTSYNLTILRLVGVLIGLIIALSIIWSTHLGVSLVASGIAWLVMVYFAVPVLGNSSSFPIALVMWFTVSSLFFVLLSFAGVLLFSRRTAKWIVKLIFPKGHPIHETFEVF